MIQLLLIVATLALFGFGLGWIYALVAFGVFVLVIGGALYLGWKYRDEDMPWWVSRG